MSTPLPKLAAPARRALESVGVKCLEDLAKFSREEIAALHGMGPNAIKSLEVALIELKLTFSDQFPLPNTDSAFIL